MAERFYINCELGLGPVLLSGAEAHHLATVCRLRAGDRVCLFNGDGGEYPAVVRSVARRRVELEVQGSESPPRELPFHLRAAVSLPKGDRAQFLIEKLTELGVAAFVPLSTERSVVHPREGKLDRLQRHVIEASKQCGRNVLMQIQPVTDWPTLCRQPELPPRRFLAHPGGTGESGLFVPGNGANGTDAVFAVGPEGGFTDGEVAQAREAGWRIVDLGPRILRVETAAIFLASCFTWEEKAGREPRAAHE
jgi:16S rRNA (uracil1498-N3)-methyltransferase